MLLVHLVDDISRALYALCVMFDTVYTAIWATSSLMDEKTADSETKAYILLRELVLYSIFLTLLVVCKYQ